MPKEIQIKTDKWREQRFYVQIGGFKQNYSVEYNEENKEIYQIHWYEGEGDEVTEIRLSYYDIMAIIEILSKYGFTLEGMKPILTSPSNVEKGEEKTLTEVK